MQKNVNVKKVLSGLGEDCKPVETKEGWKVTLPSLPNDKMGSLSNLSLTHKIEVKRSGKGIVILAEERPETDRSKLAATLSGDDNVTIRNNALNDYSEEELGFIYSLCAACKVTVDKTFVNLYLEPSENKPGHWNYPNEIFPRSWRLKEFFEENGNLCIGWETNPE